MVVGTEASASATSTLDDLTIANRDDALLAPEDFDIGGTSADQEDRRTGGSGRAASVHDLGIGNLVEVAKVRKSVESTSVIAGAVEDLRLDLEHRLTQVGLRFDAHDVVQATLVREGGTDVHGEARIEQAEVDGHLAKGAFFILDSVVY